MKTICLISIFCLSAFGGITRTWEARNVAIVEPDQDEVSYGDLSVKYRNMHPLAKASLHIAGLTQPSLFFLHFVPKLWEKNSGELALIDAEGNSKTYKKLDLSGLNYLLELHLRALRRPKLQGAAENQVELENVEIVFEKLPFFQVSIWADALEGLEPKEPVQIIERARLRPSVALAFVRVLDSDTGEATQHIVNLLDENVPVRQNWCAQAMAAFAGAPELDFYFTEETKYVFPSEPYYRKLRHLVGYLFPGRFDPANVPNLRPTYGKQAWLQ